MSENQFSKLPIWAKPLPPLALMGALVVLGYGAQQGAFPPLAPLSNQSPSTSLNSSVPEMSPPSVDLGQEPIFKAPGLDQPESPAEDKKNPSLDLNSNTATTFTKPLALSTESASGAALEKFRSSPLANTYGKALAAQKKGNLTAAIQGYRDVLHQMPDALPARLNLAVAYLQNKQPAKAIPHLQAVAKADPKNVKVQFELAKVLLNENRLNEAEIPLRQTVHLMPQNPQPRVLLAQLYYSRKDYQQAFDQWTALDKIDAGHGQPAFAAGSIAAQNLKDPSKALPWLRKAHRLAPEDDRATLLLGQVLASTGNASEAEPLLTRIAAKVPQDAGLARVLAEVQWKNGNRDAAINSLQKVVSLDAGDKEARSSLAQALSARAEDQEKAGKLTDASNTWKNIRQLYPSNPLPLIQRARILRKLGRDDDAKQLYQQVLRDTPKDPNALFGIAGIAMKQKSYDSAYTNFWKGIQIEPEYDVAYEGFVLAANKLHKEKDAYLLLQDWVKKHPRLDVAQKALKALEPAANKPPELTPLNQAPDINTDRPPTLNIPQKPQPQPAKPTTTVPDKPQMTPADNAAAKSRISPVKPAAPLATSPSPTPELTVPQ